MIIPLDDNVHVGRPVVTTMSHNTDLSSNLVFCRSESDVQPLRRVIEVIVQHDIKSQFSRIYLKIL